MPNLVRVEANGLHFNVGAAHAEAQGLRVLEESAYDRLGAPKPTTRANGRPRKPQTSVAEKAAEKKAAPESADTVTPSSPKE